MYHKIPEQEAHPENYVLKEMDMNWTEDECFDLLSKPRATQTTIGLYLKRIKDAEGSPAAEGEAAEEECKKEKKRFSLAPGNQDLEGEVNRNKCFWVGRPEHSAHIVFKLQEKYMTDRDADRERDAERDRGPPSFWCKCKPRPRPSRAAKEQGIFYRPKYFEMQHAINLAEAGLLFPDEEFTDSEEEILPDPTECNKLRKVRYKLCDPCKDLKDKPPKKGKKEEEGKEGEGKEEEEKEMKPLYKKIPTRCQCDYYWEHNKPPGIWDLPYLDEIDMQRQHEMDKVMRPFKHELLNAYYEKNPPVKVMAHEPGMKRTFPVYQISNL